MAVHNGAIDEDVGGRPTALSLEARSELASDVAGLPPAEDEQAVAQLRGTAGVVPACS